MERHPCATCASGHESRTHRHGDCRHVSTRWGEADCTRALGWCTRWSGNPDVATDPKPSSRPSVITSRAQAPMPPGNDRHEGLSEIAELRSPIGAGGGCGVLALEVDSVDRAEQCASCPSAAADLAAGRRPGLLRCDGRVALIASTSAVLKGQVCDLGLEHGTAQLHAALASSRL